MTRFLGAPRPSEPRGPRAGEGMTLQVHTSHPYMHGMKKGTVCRGGTSQVEFVTCLVLARSSVSRCRPQYLSPTPTHRPVPRPSCQSGFPFRDMPPNGHISGRLRRHLSSPPDQHINPVPPSPSVLASSWETTPLLYSQASLQLALSHIVEHSTHHPVQASRRFKTRAIVSTHLLELHHLSHQDIGRLGISHHGHQGVSGTRPALLLVLLQGC